MNRRFIAAEELGGLLREYRPGARLAGLTRLAGGSKKGVYRLSFADQSTVILYAWSEAENYWAAGPEASGDPFADATGAREFRACHAALTAAGARLPVLHVLDLSRRHYPADLALLEDVPGGSLEALLDRDSAAAARPLAMLGATLRAMRGQRSEQFGKIGRLAGRAELPEDAVARRAQRHLEQAARQAPALAAVRAELAGLIMARRAAVRPRREFGLVHGELGPDHVLLTKAGEPVLIDIEGVTYFDVEWEHAFLRLRFSTADYARLGLPAVDETRVSFYDLAQRISLVEGPLRIAETDFPDREWMLDLARWHIDGLLAEVRAD